MNKLVVDIKSLELDTFKNLSNAKADNTLRAYKADYRDFFRVLCKKHSFKSMPTEPKILALYLTHLSKYSKFSTLKKVIGLNQRYPQIKGHYIDTKHPLIMENLLGIKRSKRKQSKS